MEQERGEVYIRVVVALVRCRVDEARIDAQEHVRRICAEQGVTALRDRQLSKAWQQLLGHFEDEVPREVVEWCRALRSPDEAILEVKEPERSHTLKQHVAFLGEHDALEAELGEQGSVEPGPRRQVYCTFSTLGSSFFCATLKFKRDIFNTAGLTKTA